MATIEQSIEIATTPVEVFLFFVPQRMPYWYASEMAAEFEVSAAARPILPFRRKCTSAGKLGKKEISHTAVITRYEWLACSNGDLRTLTAFAAWNAGNWKPISTGTRVTMRSKYEMPGQIRRAIDWLITRHAVARRNREYFARLKKFAERK